ncbi:MAG: transporter permease [Pseudonocardiales bacterium]|nr:transporter permease [Jatrophihabitantaceae bacterium]MCW2604812.1 transporter permease [Pseudonocardiales bacterium]
MSIIGFPNPVNEKAARTVAAGVLILSVLTVATGQLWLTAVLAYGFIARTATGPTLSPLGQLATRVIAPQLGAPRLVPGPPKRFAQAMGAVITTAAAILHFAFGQTTAVLVLLVLISIAAALESILAVCIGCIVFGFLMRLHVIPESICEDCADVSRRLSLAEDRLARR